MFTNAGSSAKKRFRRRQSALALVGSLTLALSIAVAPPAAADWYQYGYTGGSDPIRFPDGNDHWYCKNYFDQHHEWIDAAMSQLDSQTDMYDVGSSSCSSSTDVVWVKTELNGIFGGEAVGAAECVAHVTWGVCDQYWLMIDQPQHFFAAYTNGGSDPGNWYSVNLQQTMRHELGHTAGLHHLSASGGLNPTVGAMISAWIPNGTSGWWAYFIYAPFQVGFINDYV